MKNLTSESEYVVCIDNSAYPSSLELHQVYRKLPDANGQGMNLIRLIDESGEDYLYPAPFFAPVELPEEAKATFRIAS